jgi:hypothetical protein
MAVKKERYIPGLINNGNQCFANATLQFFDAAMDGHDLDLLLGKDVSTKPFLEPNLDEYDSENPADTLDAPKKGKNPAAKQSRRLAGSRRRFGMASRRRRLRET